MTAIETVAAEPFAGNSGPSQLKQFTRRNAGRRATLEVDGAAIGAMLQVVELPFIGADYDHRDGRVGIMLGDFTGSDRHFSRTISNPGFDFGTQGIE